jgi:hypothetical protein
MKLKEKITVPRMVITMSLEIEQWGKKTSIWQAGIRVT